MKKPLDTLLDAYRHRVADRFTGWNPEKIGWRPDDWRAAMRIRIGGEAAWARTVSIGRTDLAIGLVGVWVMFENTQREPAIDLLHHDQISAIDLSDLATLACCLAILAARLDLPESLVPYRWHCDPIGRPATWWIETAEYNEDGTPFGSHSFGGAIGAEPDPHKALAMALRVTAIEKDVSGNHGDRNLDSNE